MLRSAMFTVTRRTLSMSEISLFMRQVLLSVSVDDGRASFRAL